METGERGDGWGGGVAVNDGPMPIVHVVRPRPPWRKPEYELTECGLQPTAHQSISREEFSKRLREWGQQRTAMMTCMTCMTTFQRYGGDSALAATWENDPIGAMARELEKVRWRGHNSDRRERMDVELRAIMQIVSDHREEFDAIIARVEWHEQTTKERNLKRAAARAQRK